jgi:hypothetical protein
VYMGKVMFATGMIVIYGYAMELFFSCPYQFLAGDRSAADRSGDCEYHREVREWCRGRFPVVDVSRLDRSGTDRSGDEHDDVGTARDAAEH